MGSDDIFSSRFFSASANFDVRGPSGSTRPSSPSSSLSPVRQLEALGLNAEIEELGFERASRLVPPNLVPKLPSAHSMSRSSCSGVLGVSLLIESLRGFPSSGNSISSSIFSRSFFPFSGGAMKFIIFCGDWFFATLIVGTSPKKSSSSSSRNLSSEGALGISFVADSIRSTKVMLDCGGLEAFGDAGNSALNCLKEPVKSSASIFFSVRPPS